MPDKSPDFIGGYVGMEIHAYPVAFVHVVSRLHAFIPVLQFVNHSMRAFDDAEVEYIDVDEAEPFFAH